MNKKNNRKGFTIVELVIVIAVIGILATVLIPTFGNVIGNAKDAALAQELKNEYTDFVTTMTNNDVDGYTFSDAKVIIAITEDTTTKYYTFTSGKLDETNGKPTEYTIQANDWYWNGVTMVQHPAA